MQRFFRNAGVLLKWVLLAPFLLIKGYLWVLFSMECFSFQGVVKGMQPSRCLAILGETLHPILATRIQGGAV